MKFEPFILKEQTLGALLDEKVSAHKDELAVFYVNEKIRQSWGEFAKEVDILAQGLMGLGVEKGDKVALWATNDPHWISLMFATAKIGAVLVPVNTSYRNEELKFLIEKSDTAVLIVGKGFRDHDFFETLYSIAPEVLSANPKDEIKSANLPALKRVVSLDSSSRKGAIKLTEVMDMASLVSSEDYEKRKAEIKPDDVVNMQFTSGTTGFPKGVMLSHINILNNGYWIGKNQRLSNKDKVCLPIPFFHCFGCVLGIMACINHAASMIVVENFDPSLVLNTVEKEQCTALYGVPTMFLSVLEHKRFPETNTSTLRTGIMAGSVCPEPLMRRVVEQMNMKEITICYGLTESSPVMTQTHADESFIRRVTTTGKAMPGVEVKVVNPDDMEEMRPNEPGEIVCRGYNIMKGYYKNPKATAEVVTEDGWLHTGDLGKMDEDGYLVITGRIKDMILRGGENIYPREIEEFLSGMDEVFDIQVVGVPSRTYGEEVVAFIVVREGTKLTPEKIRSFCRGQIAWQKVPRHIVFVDSFPLTASGKIQKFKLREEAATQFSHLA